MRIAVTGANGFVGQALCQHLANQGVDVIALQRAPSSSPVEHARITTTHVNYDQAENLRQALTDADAVIHLIAKTHSADTFDTLPEYRKINSGLSLLVAEACLQTNVKRLVFLSSIKVNGESTSDTPFTHNDAPKPTTAYGISKLEAETQLTSLCNDNPLELVIVRPPLIYSPHAKGNISALRKAITKGLPLPLGNIHNKRDIVDLELLCHTLHRCCTEAEAKGETLLISNDAALSTPELIEKIARDTHQKARLLNLPQSWVKFAGKLVGKENELDKLCGNLEVDSAYTKHLLHISANSCTQG